MSNVFLCECGRPIYPAKLLGGIKTAKKARSSRENGKLGWKPKKKQNDEVSGRSVGRSNT